MCCVWLPEFEYTPATKEDRLLFLRVSACVIHLIFFNSSCLYLGFWFLYRYNKFLHTSNSFFLITSFPLNEKNLRDKWLRKLNLEGWIPGPENVVCEEHFSSDSFEISSNRIILKSDAVPNNVNEWNQLLWGTNVSLILVIIFVLNFSTVCNI